MRELSSLLENGYKITGGRHPTHKFKFSKINSYPEYEDELAWRSPLGFNDRIRSRGKGVPEKDFKVFGGDIVIGNKIKGIEEAPKLMWQLPRPSPIVGKQMVGSTNYEMSLVKYPDGMPKSGGATNPQALVNASAIVDPNGIGDSDPYMKPNIVNGQASMLRRNRFSQALQQPQIQGQIQQAAQAQIEQDPVALQAAQQRAALVQQGEVAADLQRALQLARQREEALAEQLRLQIQAEEAAKAGKTPEEVAARVAAIPIEEQLPIRNVEELDDAIAALADQDISNEQKIQEFKGIIDNANPESVRQSSLMKQLYDMIPSVEDLGGVFKYFKRKKDDIPQDKEAVYAMDIQNLAEVEKGIEPEEAKYELTESDFYTAMGLIGEAPELLTSQHAHKIINSLDTYKLNHNDVYMKAKLYKLEALKVYFKLLYENCPGEAISHSRMVGRITDMYTLAQTAQKPDSIRDALLITDVLNCMAKIRDLKTIKFRDITMVILDGLQKSLQKRIFETNKDFFDEYSSESESKQSYDDPRYNSRTQAQAQSGPAAQQQDKPATQQQAVPVININQSRSMLSNVRDVAVIGTGSTLSYAGYKAITFVGNAAGTVIERNPEVAGAVIKYGAGALNYTMGTLYLIVSALWDPRAWLTAGAAGLVYAFPEQSKRALQSSADLTIGAAQIVGTVMEKTISASAQVIDLTLREIERRSEVRAAIEEQQRILNDQLRIVEYPNFEERALPTISENGEYLGDQLSLSYQNPFVINSDEVVIPYPDAYIDSLSSQSEAAISMVSEQYEQGGYDAVSQASVSSPSEVSSSSRRSRLANEVDVSNIVTGKRERRKPTRFS